MIARYFIAQLTLTSMCNSWFRSYRASWCTTKLRTERYLTLSGIHDFVQQDARYDSMPNYGNTKVVVFW